MNRLFRFLIVGMSLLSFIAASAQPSLILEDKEVTVGDELEIVLSGADFGDMSSINLSLKWDTSYLEFKMVSDIANVLDLSAQNIIRDEVDNGFIALELATKSSPILMLPEDNPWFFKLLFTTKKAGVTNIALSDFPVVVNVVREVPGVSNPIYEIRDFENGFFLGGTINILGNSSGMVAPPPAAAGDLLFKLNTDQDLLCVGEQVCYSLEVENFDSIITFQLPIAWDPDVLAYNKVENFNLAGFAEDGIGQVVDGRALTAIFLLENDQFLDGASVDDGTSIVDICFDIIGENNNNSDLILLGNNPFIATQGGAANVEEEIGIQTSVVPFESINCDNAVIINTSCGSAAPGGQVCIDLIPSLFNNVGDMLFYLDWDQTAMSYASIGNVHPELVGLLGEIDETDGTLNISWTAMTNVTQGVTLNREESIATVCFDVNASALPGTSIDIDFTDVFNFANIDAEAFDPVRLKGCGIEVTDAPLPEVILSASTNSVEQGGDVCVDILAENLTGLTSMEFPVVWDQQVLEYVETQDGILQGIDYNIESVADGKIKVRWLSNTPENLTGAEVLFSICFKAIGTAGTGTGESAITFPDTEADPILFTAGITELPVDSPIPGLVTITNTGVVPVTFATEKIENLAKGESFCVPVTVKDFNEIFSATILVQWDSLVLDLDSITNIRFPNFNPINVNVKIAGQLSLIWFDEADFESLTLDDGEALFDLCFTTTGKIGACTKINFPDELVTFGNTQPAELINDFAVGKHIGVVDEGQDICVTTFGITSSNITQPSCDGDGQINVEVSGGEAGYTFFWTVNGRQEGGFQPSSASSLNRVVTAQSDSISLTIYRPDLDQGDEIGFSIDVDDTRVPTAIAAAMDTIDVGCVVPDVHETVLQGEWGESPDANSGVVNQSWTAINGGEIKAFSDNGIGEAIAVGLGTYIYTITNANDCSASDTLVLVNSSAPSIAIESDNDFLTCERDRVVLTSTFSDESPEWKYSWKNDAGDTLATDTPFELIVEQAGRYVFTAVNESNACVGEQAIIIAEDKDTPRAEAVDVVTFRCEDRFVTLDGSASSTSGSFAIDWTSDKGIVRPSSLTPDVVSVGTYVLKITDNTNGCFGTDTVRVIADPELPVAKVRDDAFIGCDQSKTVLRSIVGGIDGSSEGAKFDYTWATANGDTLSINQDTVSVSSVGEYLFVVVNTENDACAADTARITVTENTTKPIAILPNSQTIGCSEDCVELSPSTENIGEDFSYTWITDVGAFCGANNGLTAQTNQVGTYFFVIKNTANNCSDTTQINVFPDPDNGIFAEAGPAKELTCEKDSVGIGSEASSVGPGITYEWRFEEEEAIISEELLLIVNQAGRYRLTVIDEALGCQGSGSVTVTENKDIPVANAGSDFPLAGCEVEPFKLNALNSDSGEGIVYQWSTSGGDLVEGATSLTPTVGAPGVYVLEVTNEISGCAAIDEVVVSTETFAPAAIAGEDQVLDCVDNAITIDATSSITTNGTDVATIEWTTEDGHILAGATTLDPVIDSAGTYLLTLTAENGCSDTDEVVVTNIAEIPSIDAGEGFKIVCNEQTTIDASNSSFSDNLLIQWVTADGSIVSGATTLMPEINRGGTYILTIKDTTNNCEVRDEVFVDSDGELPIANAGDNQEVCSREAMLTANAVSGGIVGAWSTLNGSSIASNDVAETLVSDLSPGNNQFIWTLSSDDCPDFSSDTIAVNALTLPTANADDFEYIVGEGSVMLDLVVNDQTNTDNFNINLLSEPIGLTLDKVAEGVYLFDLPARPIRQEFQYEICSQTCADVCDDAFVNLVVRPVALDSLEFNPNAITPNGDGLNDVLIFDELYIEDFPQSQLVVFNRWGDIVYEVTPYNNDWQGEALNGTNLPEGTYYYILRLDISEGDIIRGDVTILK